MDSKKDKDNPQVNLYTKTFYNSQADDSYQSAKKIIPLVIEILGKIDSVIDLGCGVGVWLSAFKEYGVSKIVGADGDYVNREMLCIAQSEFVAFDLAKPLNLENKFDLAMSVEVAEHLPEKCSKTFIDSLCNHSDTILFSAAIPGQMGANHVNEQYPTYWISLFGQNGYSCIDCLRGTIWNDSEIRYWYKQNIMLFVKNGSKLSEKFTTLAFEHPLDIVHPESFYIKSVPNTMAELGKMQFIILKYLIIIPARAIFIRIPFLRKRIPFFRKILRRFSQNDSLMK